ncbi:hypothetical protein [Phyllobacterium myrsinacearum]|uniref:Uncharacterized protein n=1 Tax=Phyllobacterium myrsinacearum TaxID=28101 RepID=A0A839EQ42_9HYPH|nr:hypothetical protein [Phyllobacterium myrsinacearum]MBA8879536.1 hypothetical protein [Phyllobacterium myrsinacearum]
MGLLDWISGAKAPKAGVAPVATSDLLAALLTINRTSAPFIIRKDNSGSTDLIAEWKIVDAGWYEIFGRAHLTKVARVLMRFDEAQKEVRSCDEMWTVEWHAGIPNLSASAEYFRGQQTSIEFGTGYAFTEELQYGQVYNYRFSTKELKSPLQEVVSEHGWRWRPVAFGKL